MFARSKPIYFIRKEEVAEKGLEVFHNLDPVIDWLE